MYSRCITCHADLGRNESLEASPVGRRFAFDSWKGRLWVLCPVCRAWNLSPIEERWEAIEEAERCFEGAVVGSSTDNIALRHLRDGTRLIRVGRAQRRELAVWRYANRLSWRWRRSEAFGFVVAAAVAGLGTSTGLGLGLIPIALGGMATWATFSEIRDARPTLRTQEDHVIRTGDARRALLLPSDNAAGWALLLARRHSEIELEGPEALRVLRKLLPRANLGIGKHEDVESAVLEVTHAGSADSLIRSAATRLRHNWNMDPHHTPLRVGAWGRARPHRIVTADPVIRLALEMAANEETERRILAGEMALLEREWREAEELAAIADNLLLPGSVRSWMRRHGERL